MNRATGRAGGALLLGAVLFLLQSCDDYPRDPEGTLDRVRGGTLRAGIVENPPWALRDGEEPEGIEVRLVERLAQSLDARVERSEASGPRAYEELVARRLYIRGGGLTEGDPWLATLGVTRPYIAGRNHVVVVPSGENAWLIFVDRFFSRNGPKAVAAEWKVRP